MENKIKEFREKMLALMKAEVNEKGECLFSDEEIAYETGRPDSRFEIAIRAGQTPEMIVDSMLW